MFIAFEQDVAKNAASSEHIVNVRLANKRAPVLQPLETFLQCAEGALNVFLDLAKRFVHHPHVVICIIVEASDETAITDTHRCKLGSSQRTSSSQMKL